MWGSDQQEEGNQLWMEWESSAGHSNYFTVCWEVWPLLLFSGPCKNSSEKKVTGQRGYEVLPQFCWDCFSLGFCGFVWGRDFICLVFLRVCVPGGGVLVLFFLLSLPR